MSFREKSTWICLAVVLVAYGAYFGGITGLLGPADRGGYAFGLLVICVVGQVAALTVLHTIVAIQAPKEAGMPEDERERVIGWKATTIAFPVLVTGVLAAAVAGPLGFGSFVVTNLILGALALTQLVLYGSKVLLFRRQA